MAASDADYKFIFVDIGALGHNNDSTAFRNSEFGKAIIGNSGSLDIPTGKELPGSNIVAPFVFVADEAFPLLQNIMRPYPGRNTGNLPQSQEIFNYRLSKARRVVESAFGILTSRWRIYRRPILASKGSVKSIIKATTCLHNWLRIKNSRGYITSSLLYDLNSDGTATLERWREEAINGVRPIGRISSNNSTRAAIQTREDFKNYFSNNPISI